jgi:predicted acyl esterase
MKTSSLPLFLAALLAATRVLAIGPGDQIALPSPATSVGPGYDIEMSRMIPMRDGVELEAWIFKPSNLKGKAPAVFTLTQYDVDGDRHGADSAVFVRRGYVFVQVLVRGRGRSGGVKSDSLGLQVGRDGHDVVEWIAAQPWSDGRVVMYGGSFVGMSSGAPPLSTRRIFPRSPPTSRSTPVGTCPTRTGSRRRGRR